ncbi:hypothetical protein NYE80_15990 [Paenibacillus sp. FSL H7-0357]
MVRALFPKYAVSLKEIGLAMIHLSVHGSDRDILESREIAAIAREQ